VHHEFNFKENETLIGSIEPQKLGLVLELLCPKHNPRVVTVPAIFLIATTETEVRAYRRAIQAADEYGQINLLLEAGLPHDLDDAASHAVRLKIAKARASRIAEVLWTYVKAAEMETSAKARFLQLEGWPQRFRLIPPNKPEDRAYNESDAQQGHLITLDHSFGQRESIPFFSSLSFEVIGKESPFPVLWRHLPKDDISLLEHNLPFVTYPDTDQYKMIRTLQDLGIDEALTKARQ
jgi:hypothetical protein